MKKFWSVDLYAFTIIQYHTSNIFVVICVVIVNYNPFKVILVNVYAATSLGVSKGSQIYQLDLGMWSKSRSSDQE